MQGNRHRASYHSNALRSHLAAAGKNFEKLKVKSPERIPRSASYRLPFSATIFCSARLDWNGCRAYTQRDSSHGLFRKEVIQPQVLLRLPCYDFTPIMNHTLGLLD